MIGYIVRCVDTNEYINWQNLKTEDIKNALVLKTEADAIAVASGQNCDTVVIEHEYVPTVGNDKAGTYFEYHRTF